jgi:D-tyrosyl-tRNA(Tyr) deacylase
MRRTRPTTWIGRRASLPPCGFSRREIADARKGRRPSLSDAADPVAGREKFDQLVAAVRAQGVDVRVGQFGADMEVSLVNDGPVTFVLDSRQR